MSLPLLESYAQQLPRIAAQESLRRASEIALGTGSLERDEQRRILRNWEDAADSGRSTRRRPVSAAQQLATLEAMGLRVVHEQAAAPAGKD